MEGIRFLITTAFDLYLMVILLRLWMQWARADFYNPISQFVVKVTQPILKPLRKVIPAIGGFDTATFVFALVIGMLKIIALTFVVYNVIPSPLNFAVAGFFTVLKAALNLVFWILIIRALMSWFSQGNNPAEQLFGQLTEPMLSPIRRILPPIGGLDLSVMVLIIGIQFIIISLPF